MKLLILIDDHPVEIEQGADILAVEPGVFSILLGGRSYEVRVAEGGVELAGRQFRAEIRDLRDAPQELIGAVPAGRQNIIAPMPGRVIKLLVSEGDTVGRGRELRWLRR